MLQFILKASFSRVKLLSLLAAGLSLLLLIFDSEKIAILYFVFHVFTLGIAHGSLDRWMFNLINPSKSISSSVFYLSYIAVMTIIALFWWLSPFWALLFFVTYSAWHFGEVEWIHIFNSKSSFQRIYAFIWGAFLFATMFYFNLEETYALVSKLIKIDIEPINFTEFTGFILLSSWFLYSNLPSIFKWISLKNTLTQLLNIFSLGLIFYRFDLTISFAVFFFYFHSLPSLVFELRSIGNSDIKPSSYTGLIKEMMVLSIAPILLGVLITIFGSKSMIELLIPILVVIGSAISFPHTFIYSMATKRKQIQKS